MTPNKISKEKISFVNDDGETLSAALERPQGDVRAFGIFAHCFSCSKDIPAASRISRALAARGIAILRFDFTGLGHSEGDFANTNFSSNVRDIVNAADYMREHLQAPALLVGHSLGGAAVLAAAGEIPECRAVSTVGAPADPAHVSHLFADSLDDIARSGSATVNIAGREFEIKKQFLDDIAKQSLHTKIASMRKPLLVFHSPLDTIVTIDNASAIFAAAKHPKSFVSLAQADHLLSKREDSDYVAATLSAWAERYILGGNTAQSEKRPPVGQNSVLVREVDQSFTQEIYTDSHALLADEPASIGGAARGPTPYEYLLAALGACTTMTLRMYAKRKNIALKHASVTLAHSKIHAQDCAECETKEGRVDQIERVLELSGDLTEEERERLTQIADRCPVHRTLHSEVHINTIVK